MTSIPNWDLRIFTRVLIFLLIGPMSAKTVLSSHHLPQIAFASTRDGNAEIYVMASDGHNQVRLTHHPAIDIQPSWSPNGRKIAFVSNRNGGNIQIYLMDSNGRNLMRLTDGAWNQNPAWSPNGRQIAFESTAGESNLDIYVIGTDGRHRTRLTGAPRSNAMPAWSPDARRIAYASWLGGRSEIYVMDADGENQTRLTHNLVNERELSWSPDGSEIAFASWDGEGTVISVIGADGENRKNLTEGIREGFSVRDSSPAWSPDGRWIAYGSVTLGLNEGKIYLMTSDGEHLKRLSNVHKGGDFDPDWYAAPGLAVSPAGNQLTIWGKLKNLASNLR
ncbi:MAG: hypothetical protein OXN17_01490 [Candidatus Poribacteria bacterium]|nr:hypothetical protein [Candidatus Poribacteria bacterium]MDE0503483.1 hypothetical protein [Candidatus Poribacteria bacterium]